MRLVEIYLHINVKSADWFELRIEFVAQSHKLVLEISPFYIFMGLFQLQVIIMTLLHYYLLRCSALIEYYTVSGNVAFRCWISLHPGKLGLGLLFSFFHFYQEKEPNMILWNASYVLSPPTGTRWSGSNLCGTLSRPICPREGILLCELATSNMNFWIFFTEIKESDAKHSVHRHHGLWKSLEDLKFWKLMNELSISTCADFT